MYVIELQHPPRAGDVGRVVQSNHIGFALDDQIRQRIDSALLLLVEAPSQNSRQPGIDRNARIQFVLGWILVRFEDYWRPLDIFFQPVDHFQVIFKRDRRCFIIHSIVHIFITVQGVRRIRGHTHRDLALRGHDRKQRGDTQQGGDEQQPGNADYDVPFLGRLQ